MGCRCLKMFYGGVLPEEKELSPKNPSQNNKPKTKLFNRVKVTSKIFKKKQDGVKIINDYIICETIGEGLFGKVKKVKKIEGGQQKIYAMKILSKALMSKKKYYYKDQNGVLQTKDGYEYFRRQFAVFKKIRHNNLIRLYEVIMNQQNQKIYLIIELAEKGQLLKWDDDQNSWKFTDPRRSNVTEDQLRNICRGCIKGLYHLHQNNIIHRDLKPQNILFNNQNQVKISDFGISLLTSHVRVNQLKGTDFFLSPQCFQAQRTKELDGRAIDVWGLGVTLYCFYFQKLPFYEAEFQDLINSIKSKKVEYGMKSISKQLIQLLEHMLEKDPNKRITIQGMIDNPWVNINHTSLYQQLKTEIIEVNSSDLKSSINIVTKKSSHNQQLLKKNMHQQLDKQKVPSINQTIIRRPQRPLSKITEEDQNAAQTQRALFYQTPQKNQLQIPLTTIGRLTQSRQIGPQG